jgi:hypothetical protein
MNADLVVNRRFPMLRLPHLFAALGGLLLALWPAPRLLGMGSPPLITDDPDTPGDGHWEINIGLSTERRPGLCLSELPLLDLNYGIGDRLQLKYEMPYLRLSEDGSPTQSDFGNSDFGVKWRFYDAGEKGAKVSVYPQLEFNNPGSSSKDKGLVESGSAFKLPFEFQREFGGFDVVAEAGREFSSGGDTWLYGISVSHGLSEKVELGVELAGEADCSGPGSVLATNVAIVVNLSERTSLMFSVGRELHNRTEDKATFLGYVGLQLRL